jgi:hypothetical protein
MKTFEIRLRLNLILLIVFTFLLTNCKKEKETVLITPNISVELPENYKYFVSHSTGSDRTNPDLIINYENYNYAATINNDEIFITKRITDEYDGLDFNEKAAKLKIFTKGFARGFASSTVIDPTSKEKEINGLAQSEFNFNFEENDNLFILYGRLIIQDTNLILFGYKTKFPSTNGSIKDKDEFFNSVKYN